jgi:serine/threonine-protein kinase
LNVADVIDARYRLDRLLGTGGMAEVWLAQDQRLGRWVALKVLRESVGTDGDLVAGLEREARLIAQLQHPNIVGVYDTGVHEGRHYLVMEYVHGYSLRQLLETQGRLTEGEAIRYGMQVAAALQYAHERGVIHCDIKPENILVNETGVVKVADFGVADTLTRTLAPNQARDILGTIAYLAPEIIQGFDADPRSDVYSLGLTVYELVAGRLPFAGSTPAAVAGQRLGVPPALLRSFARSASPELEATLARALALPPGERFQTAAEFLAALRRVPPSRGPGAPTIAPPGRAPRPVEGQGGIRRRHTTARIDRGPSRLDSRPRRGRPAATTVLVTIGVVLLALGVGIAGALVIADRNNGGSPAPTPTATVAGPTALPTRTSTPRPTNEPTLTPVPSPSPSPSPTTAPSPTVKPSASPSPATATPGTATPKPSPSPGPTATVTP